MKWSKEAEEAVSRVPFFVRKKVRKRVEEEAVLRKAAEVRLEHVNATRKKFLENMEKEVRGYQVETCFGTGGCPNRAVDDEDVAGKLEILLAAKKLREFLEKKVKGPLKMHHEFRVSVSCCPNACSRPQIVDIGLIGASEPAVTEEPCSHCGLCVEACREGAVSMTENSDSPPVIDREKCVTCGLCAKGCPAGTLAEGRSGYRILVGGKLGRHPQLGKELEGIYPLEEALEMVEKCLNHHLKHNLEGERFGELLNRAPLE